MHRPHPIRQALYSSLLLSGVLLGISSSAASSSHTETHLEKHLESHCFQCHGEEKTKGGLNLEELLAERPLIKNRERWNHVVDLITHGEMPPEDEPQPTQNERTAILHQLDQALNHFDYSQIDNPGFEEARRLTNDEYNNTVSDLFGLRLRPADRFPADMTGASGFDNSANTLFLQVSRMERFIAAAERIVEAALPSDIATKDQSPAYKRFFVAVPGPQLSTNAAAQKVIRQFLLRAYRRPPTEAEIAGQMSYFQSLLRPDSGITGFADAMRQVAQATLISPKFLLRIEQGQTGETPFRITDFELASRLSYFLWSSMPDDALFQLAEEGRLSTPEVLRGQITRMIQDPKSHSLGTTFAAQWLGYQFMGNRVRLDPIDNPWCTDTLMNAMREESGLFFTSLVQENRTMDELLTGNYTFLNEELANEIYGIDSVKGTSMRRVVLNNPDRSGILTHGSLMAVTSNYKETSPIKRGNWILETVLGRPLPPPPPNAGAFKEEVEENDALTFREKVELHSSDPSCRSCHSKIDPLGFSLENFDYFGRWRENYRVRRLERQDEHALELVSIMRSLSSELLEEIIADLDSGPDARERIRKQLNNLRSLSDEALNVELTQTMPVSAQNRLIRLLDWMDIPEHGGEGDASELLESVARLRAMTKRQIDQRFQKLDLDLDDFNEISEVVRYLRSVSELTLQEKLSDLEDDDQDELMEVLYLMGVFGDESDEDEPGLMALVLELRSLNDNEVWEKVKDLDVDTEERAEILEGAKFLRSLPEADLVETVTKEFDEEFQEEIYEVLLEMELIDEPEGEEERERRRPRFEQRPITGMATLPDGTPFQGPAGLRQVILSHHRDDLSRQLTSKMLAYALGRQLEYYDEGAIRTIMESFSDADYRFPALIQAIATSYPFQYKKNPSLSPQQ